MKDNRYQEIKKENDLTISHLSNAYQRLATTYTKKARGYAVKNTDTELKIQGVLAKLEDYDMRNILINIAIPNEAEFIEGNIKELSKQVKDPNRWKTILGISIIGLVIVAWFVINIWMKKESPNQTPQNLRIEVISETQIKLSWDVNNFATEGYYVWKVDNTNKKDGPFEISENEYIFIVEKNKTYTFYVQTIPTDIFDKSAEAQIKYPN